MTTATRSRFRQSRDLGLSGDKTAAGVALVGGGRTVGGVEAEVEVYVDGS